MMARVCISVISGIDDAQAAAAQAEHGVELVQFLDAPLNLLHRHAHLGGEVLLRGFLVGQEFVEGRVEGADGRRAGP